MRSRRPIASLLAWSVIGLLAGHQAAYLLVYRDPAVLAHVLEDTGHGWLWIAPVVAASAVLMALILGFGGGEPVRSFRWRFSALALVQVGTFVALEVTERIAHDAGASDIVTSLRDTGDWPVVVVGTLFQLLTAYFVALASRAVERVMRAVRRPAPRRVRVPRVGRPQASPGVRPHGLLLARSCGSRAPPACA